MVKRSDLVVSLATVSLTALSGSLGDAGVETARLVTLARSIWDQGSSQRKLRAAVEGGITQWANGEKMDAAAVDRGLGWAIEYVQKAGSTHEVLAEADFDAERATRTVLDAIKRSDRYWGTEAEYAVAERAVRATYQALCASLKSEGGLPLATLQATRHAIMARIDELHNAVAGTADRTELINHLETKIKLWDFSPWTQGKAPSELERTLQLETREPSPRRSTVSEALDGTWLLTVLGGPGSGKTWLAQRCAREAAETAITQLRDPLIDPGSVEIPILTTWSDWARQQGESTDTLATAALPSPTEDRVRRSVLRPGARVFAIIDSLDEIGVSEYRARTLLRSLTVSPGWRVIVTSRPEAWHSAQSALPGTDALVGTLIDLTYPNDVQGFISKWFRHEPKVATHLTDQLKKRTELHSTATIPLLLTFYCMLTEQTPDEPLPWRRRELYRRIIDLLLRGRWSGDAPDLDLESCRKILQEWAWDAIKDANDVAGLGTWPDTITTGLAPKDLERALDHVAPKQSYPTQSKYDRNRVERRFLHRTLLEHCVAEQIATFDANDAVTALLPHLWFDPDWEVAAPMALAAHPRRDYVLDGLLRYRTEMTDNLRAAAQDELTLFLLRTAAMSLPENWDTEHQRLFNNLRRAAALAEPELISTSSVWLDSNLQIVKTILDKPLRQGWRNVDSLASALLSLGSTEQERTTFRKAIINQIPKTTNPWEVDFLASALQTFAPTEQERTTFKQAIINQLPKTTDPWEVESLASALQTFAPTEQERTTFKQAIITQLPKTTNPWEVKSLTNALQTLGPTEQERTTSKQELINQLPKTKLREVSLLANALQTLGPTEQERTTSKQELINQLPKTKLWEVESLANALQTLGPTEQERTTFRKAIINQLPKTTDPWEVKSLTNALQTLDPTEQERTTFRKAIINQLPKTTNPWEVKSLTNALQTLDPTEQERTTFKQELINQLPKTDLREVSLLANALQTLGPTEQERTTFKQELINQLPKTDLREVSLLANALQTLGPTEQERTTFKQELINQLPKTDLREVSLLASALQTLGPTEQECTTFREAIINQLPKTTNPWEIESLASALLSLGPTEQECTTFREAIINQLPKTTNPWEIESLASALLSLGPTEQERTTFREAIITQLPKTDLREVSLLASALQTLGPTEQECTTFREAIINQLPKTTNIWEFESLTNALQTLGPTEQERTTSRKTPIDQRSQPTQPAAGYLAETVRRLLPVTEWLGLLS